MKESKIKFIREYASYKHTWYEIIYKSGRIITLPDEDIPKTAREYITNATRREEQYNSIFNRHEVIHMA